MHLQMFILFKLLFSWLQQQKLGKKCLNNCCSLHFLVSRCFFSFCGLCVVKRDADTRTHEQRGKTAHLLAPGDDKVNWKSVSGYSTWKRRYQWLGRLNPRCPWPRRCWALSHLHVHDVRFCRSSKNSRSWISAVLTRLQGTSVRITVLCKCLMFVGWYSLVIWD